MSKIYDILSRIVPIVGANYIKFAGVGLCWGKIPAGSFSSINAQARVDFPFSFKTTPTVVASWVDSATGGVYNQLTIAGTTVSYVSVWAYKSGGSVQPVNWIAVGFID